MTSLVSIIVPVHNVQKYLAKCIKSIIGQTYKNLEIILIDDGSTDHSLNIIEKFAKKDKRIKFYSNNLSQGVGSARNIALDMATGEYITFLDSDDWLPKRAVETLMTLTSKHNADICQARYKIVGTIGSKQSFSKTVTINNCDNGFLRKDWFTTSSTGSACCKFFRHSIIKDYNLRFGNAKLYEDTIFMCRYVKHSNICVVVDDYTYYYNRLNFNSAILSKHNDMCYWIRDWIEAYLDIFQHELNDDNFKEINFTDYIDNICCRVVSNYVLRYPKEECLVYIEKIKEILTEIINKYPFMKTYDKNKKYYNITITDKEDIYNEFSIGVNKNNDKIKSLIRRICSPILYFFIYKLNWLYKD